MIISQYRIIAAGLVALALFLSGWHAHKVVTEAALAKTLAEETEQHLKQEAEAFKKSSNLEEQLATLRQEFAQLNESTKDEVKAPIYSSCIVPNTGIMLYNQAITGKATR